MKHKRLLKYSVIIFAIGFFILIIGNMIAGPDVTANFMGLWIFGPTLKYPTMTYSIGIAISLAGLSVIIIGIYGVIFALILEGLARAFKMAE